MYIERSIYKQIVIHSYNGVLLSNRKEWTVLHAVAVYK